MVDLCMAMTISRAMHPATTRVAGAVVSSPTAISVDTSIAAIEIVATGSLWSIVPERFARQAIKDGRIFRAPGEPILMRQAHYLLRPDNAEPLSGQAVAFSRWLQDLEEIEADPA